jgi:hypothetical protein
VQDAGHRGLVPLVPGQREMGSADLLPEVSDG